MPYLVTRSNGLTINVDDGAVNNDTNIQLVGINTPNYEVPIAENFVRLLENFSSDQAPGSTNSNIDGDPIEGQLWYNSATNQLSFYTGTEWKQVLDENSNLPGNAATATRLENSRQISLTGDASGATLFDGSQNVFINSTVTKMDGKPASFYLAFSNMTGTINDNQLPAYYSGVSQFAQKLETPRSISLTGDVSGSVSFDGSRNVTISAVVADNSHSHDNSYYTKPYIDDNYYDKSYIDSNLLTLSTSDNRYLRLTGGTVTGALTVEDYVNVQGQFSVDGTSTFSSLMTIGAGANVTGDVAIAGNLTADNYDTNSDVALKSDIEDFSIDINSIKKIKAKKWKWKAHDLVSTYLHGQEDSGIIAQDIYDIPELRHCVSKDVNTGNLKVNHGKLALHLALALLSEK